MNKLPQFRDIDHNKPADCQLLLAVTGTKGHIISVLERLLRECNDNYGKPRQGIFIKDDGTSEIITPVWLPAKF